MARTLLRGGIVLPMSGRSGPAGRAGRSGPAGPTTVFDPGPVLMDGEVIVAVGPVAEVDADPRAAGPDVEVIDLAAHAVLPGLQNCHLHSGLLRGTAESLSLWDWLKTYVDPAHKALTPEIAAVASRQCYAESVLAGTTSVFDLGGPGVAVTLRCPAHRGDVPPGHPRAADGDRPLRLA